MTISKHPIYTLAPLLLVLIIDVMGFGLVLPILGPLFTVPHDSILPATASVFVRNLMYGVTMGLFALCAFLGSPFLGDCSDQFGRRKVLVVCLLGTALGYGLAALAIIWKSITLLLISRAVNGFMAGSQPLAQAAIIDMSTAENKTTNLSLISLASCVGFVIGPLMGGYFSTPTATFQLDYSTPFIIAGLLSLANLVGLLFSFRETFHPTEKKPLQVIKGLLTFIDAFTHKKIRLLSFVLLLSQLGWMFYFQYVVLFFAQHYHYSTAMIGNFMAFLGVVFGITMLFIIRLLLKWLAVEEIVKIGLQIATLSLIAITLLDFPWAQWLFVVPLTIGIGISYTSLLTLFSNAVDKNAQGWVMGVASAVFGIAFLLGSLLSGMLGFLNSTIPFALAVFLLLASVFLLRFYKSV